jgi:hypothetical protein
VVGDGDGDGYYEAFRGVILEGGFKLGFLGDEVECEWCCDIVSKSFALYLFVTI